MAMQATTSSPPLVVGGDGYFQCLECPLTLQYMQDPVIDPHGHTFERSKIMLLIKEPSDENNQKFQCPFTKEWVNVDRLYPNRMVKDITLEIQNGLESRIAAVIHQEISHQSQSLKAEFRAEYHQSIKDLQQVCATLVQERDLAAQQQSALQEQLDQSKQENQQKDKEIENGCEKIKKQEDVIKEKDKLIEEKEVKIKEKDKLIEEKDAEKSLYQLALGGVCVIALYLLKK